MAAQPTITDEDMDDTGPLYVEVTIGCLYCGGTGKTPWTLGLHTCGYCHGMKRRTLKRPLTPREMTILLHAFQEADEPTEDGKEA